MVTPIEQLGFVKNFTCLGAACPDTCCHGWGMQTDIVHRALYSEKAPELLASIDSATQEMKRDAATDHCVKFTEGQCGIQRQYGSDFLSDSCHFFPRIFYTLAGRTRMTATLACPEVVRLMLQEAEPFSRHSAVLDRMPGVMANLTPDLEDAEIHNITDQCMALAADEVLSPEEILSHLVHAAYGLEGVPVSEWNARLPALLHAPRPPAVCKASDPYALWYGFMLIVAFTQKQPRPPLASLIHRVEQALDCRFDPQTRDILLGDHASHRLAVHKARWHHEAERAMAPALRRWIQAQLTNMAFPFGRKISLPLSMAMLVHHFTVLRLVCMCHVDENGVPPENETVMRVIQIVARVMNHLSDVELPSMIYRDGEWLGEQRLLGLL